MSEESIVPYRLERTGLGYLRATPRPSADELEAFYREKYFQRPKGSYQASYDEEELKFFRNAGRVAAATASRRSVPTSVLDLGCGEGFFAAAFAASGWAVACCDWSSFGLEHFNPALRSSFSQCGADEMILDMERGGRRFGIVNLQNVLEHVLEPEALLRSVMPVMTENGLLRIRVPNDYSAFQRLLIERGATSETWFCPPEHLNYFDAAGLRALVEACGYEVVSLQCSFPIELFLLNEHSNYATDRTRGKAAHRARVLADNFLVEADIEAYIDYAEAAAKLGFGRELIAYAAPHRAVRG